MLYVMILRRSEVQYTLKRHYMHFVDALADDKIMAEPFVMVGQL